MVSGRIQHWLDLMGALEHEIHLRSCLAVPDGKMTSHTSSGKMISSAVDSLPEKGVRMSS